MIVYGMGLSSSLQPPAQSGVRFGIRPHCSWLFQFDFEKPLLGACSILLHDKFLPWFFYQKKKSPKARSHSMSSVQRRNAKILERIIQAIEFTALCDVKSQGLGNCIALANHVANPGTSLRRITWFLQEMQLCHFSPNSSLLWLLFPSQVPPAFTVRCETD